MPQYTRPWKRSSPVQPPGLRPPNDGCVDWRTQGPAAEVLAMPAPTPRKPEPRLEVNRQPGHDLERLVELIGALSVCRQLNVHEKTLYRWRTDRSAIPGHQHLAIQGLLGDLPGTAGKWSGWRFWQGLLCSPAGDAFAPGQVLALVLLRQQLTARDREIHDLKIKLAIAENAIEHLAPAANEARARG